MRPAPRHGLARVAGVGALALALLGPACLPEMPGNDPALDGLALFAVQPGVIVPGSLLVIDGRSFVPDDWGASRLRITGTLGGRSLDLALDVAFVDGGRLEVRVLPDVFARFGGEGALLGQATVEVDSVVDDTTHVTAPVRVSLEVRRELAPTVTSLLAGVRIFVNDPIPVTGDGLLLGGEEGRSIAVVQGCFTAVGADLCLPQPPAEVEVVPDTPFDRARGSFRFAPEIAGIRPGSFTGTVTIENRHAAGAVRPSGPLAAAFPIGPPMIASLGTGSASLGQYVDVAGGGFVGDPTPDDGEPVDGVTLVALSGTLTSAEGMSAPVQLTLLPDFAGGRLLRYALNEEDQLGSALPLRGPGAAFVGTATPIVQWRGDELSGAATPVRLTIAPVKQIVHLDFVQPYVESLRHYGLRAADSAIRARVVEILARDYATINLEVRLDRPTDFAQFSTVEIGGPDPNGKGQFGYDNTPGKDVGNLRLYDLIGGFNALSLGDGSSGYGGVFIEAMFVFSEHPGDLVPREREHVASPVFDRIFDPFRPDRGGAPLMMADVAGGVPATGPGDCPATDRRRQVACAVRTLANLIGSTLSHEIGHSLGLANPTDPSGGFHNPGDQPNRMMDPLVGRPFEERAELAGQGPSVFCQAEYEYLRQILPTSLPADPSPRPTCL